MNSLQYGCGSRIVTLADAQSSTKPQTRTIALGEAKMSTCEIEASSSSFWSRLFTVLLFLLLQGVVVLWVAFMALMVSFEPVWSAETLPAAFLKPSDARSGSLLLRGDDATYADATRLGIDVDLTVSGPTIRARVT